MKKNNDIQNGRSASALKTIIFASKTMPINVNSPYRHKQSPSSDKIAGRGIPRGEG
jgi:hypothetical protein